jgi:cytochrome P450
VTVFDPFEDGFAAWPYDQYRRLREHDPVHWSELLGGWVLTRYDDVANVLRDPTVSSELEKAKPSAALDFTRMRAETRDLANTTLVLLDDPRHARLRRLMQAPFTARAIERLRASIERRVAHAIDVVSARGAMELISDFAYPLPVGVFCEMLGFPDEDGPRFREWTAAVARSLDLVIDEVEYERCIGLLTEMEEYLASVAAQKRAEPADDELSALVHAEVDGERLEDGELVAQLVTLYVAGHEPTTALIGNAIAHLLDHPDQLARLHAHPELVTTAVHEFLRYDGPNQFLRRIALQPMTIGDRAVEPGDVLYLGVGAANHDPQRFGPDADRLDITRADAAAHVQFGGGIHHCLGAHLARVQAEVALRALLGELHDLRADGDVAWSGRMTLRSVARVPIAYRPTAPASTAPVA